MVKILIIDDDTMLVNALALVIQGMGYETEGAGTLAEGLAKAGSGDFGVIILDIRLPDGSGLEILPRLRQGPGAPEVIILTGMGDPDDAELSIRHGAWGYITKPPTLNKIKLPVQRAVEYHAQKTTRQPLLSLKRCGIAGSSRSILACLETTVQAAGSEANALITGETGTGKELFARAIHANSARSSRPFVVVDCAALPDNLVESMLFGHEKGAFTGADKKSEGLILQADGGVLFLDEVGELPMVVQKAFLRVLQDRRFRPVGGTKEVASDFRLVAATNRNLDHMVSTFAFRNDLLFRLRTVSLDLPPLRERLEDAQELCYTFMDAYCASRKLSRKGFSPEFLESLLEYDWPGNVRELFHAVESAIMSAEGDPFLYPRHLPLNIRAQIARRSLRGRVLAKDASTKPNFDPKNFPLLKVFREKTIQESETQYLRELLALTGGNILKACALSGLSRARLYALLKERGVER